MNGKQRCETVALGGFRCELLEGHRGAHQASSMHRGRPFTRAWTSDIGEPAAVDVTLEDLLEHLRDLEQLARHEGFENFGDLLRGIDVACNEQRTAAGARVAPPSAHSGDTPRQ